MNIKNLLKGLNLALLASIAFASDCDEIQKYLQERKIDYNYNIRKCVCTKDGKLDTMYIFFYYYIFYIIFYFNDILF